jgi:hypothetical protein
MLVRPRHALLVAFAVVGTLLVPVGPAMASEPAPPATVTATVPALPRAAAVPAGLDLAAAATASIPVETDVAFSMIGFRLPAHETASEVQVRTRGPEGWTGWEPLDVDEPGVDGPDLGSPEAEGLDGLTTEPLWVGEADAFQVALDGEVADLQATLIDTQGLNESAVRRTFRKLFRRAFVPAAEAAVARPSIITRSQWGANESIRRSGPSYASRVTFAVAHHTAGSNSYSKAQSASVVRGIYEYHVRSNGWSDIGYNILVDKYGQIFEGRYGGLNRGVIGAHAAGYNTGSFGVGVLGNYEVADLPSAAVNAVNRVVAWKYDVHGIDARHDRRITVNGRTINVFAGHRDVGSTACPGRYFTRKMPDMRRAIESIVKGGQRQPAASPSPAPSPSPSPSPSPQPLLLPVGVPAGAVPLAGDWNGDGRSQPGWFHGGTFYLASGPAGVTNSFRFGRAGDRPVAGDWNGNGRDGIGVFRRGHWYLRNSLSAGPSDRNFRYGRAGDQPVAGDWNRSGRDGIGVFRGGQWFVRNRLSAGSSWRHFRFGRAGDVAVAGDWQRRGRDGVGVRRGGTWYVRSHLKAGPSLAFYGFGRANDRPVVGDWNRDGRSTSGIVRGDEWRFSNRMPAAKPSHGLVYGPYDLIPR